MLRARLRSAFVGAFVAWTLAAVAAASQSTTPVPKPSPFPAGTASPQKPAAPAPGTPASPQDGGHIDPRLTGVPIYPGAALLSSFDTGRGQWVFTLGTDMPYSDIVAYYRNQMRSGGTEVFRTPLMHQFDLGPFRSDTMTYRPGIVVKDYTTDGSGYLHVSGTTETRYRTVIQIVPAK